MNRIYEHRPRFLGQLSIVIDVFDHQYRGHIRPENSASSAILARTSIYQSRQSSILIDNMPAAWRLMQKSHTSCEEQRLPKI